MIHLIKLAVGVRDAADLRTYQADRLAQGLPLRHLTRHGPRRADDITDGGSLYWVISGMLLLRQCVTAIAPAERADGSACTAFMLHPDLVAVVPRPVKAFQGWRYLQPGDAPLDLTGKAIDADLPPEMARELRALCLL